MNRKNIGKASPDFIYRIIDLIHDSKLMAIIRNPDKLLKMAGLKPGLKVLEGSDAARELLLSRPLRLLVKMVLFMQ